MNALKSMLFFLSITSVVGVSFECNAAGTPEGLREEGVCISKIKIIGSSDSLCKVAITCKEKNSPSFALMDLIKKRGITEYVEEVPRSLRVLLSEEGAREIWFEQKRLSLFNIEGELNGRPFVSCLYRSLVGDTREDGFENIVSGNSYILNISFNSLREVDGGTALPCVSSLEKQ